jgi:RNA-directed DNA polymerase
MKRFNNLFEQICSYENIDLAFSKAKLGKYHYTIVQKIEASRQVYLSSIEKILSEKSFQNSMYHHFTLRERDKEREISSLPFFPDRIVHHAIMQIIEPIFRTVYIHDTYASIKGRGIHACVKRLKVALSDLDNTQYCLKMDIRKFYQNINHEILKKLIARKIKDSDVLKLLSDIIESAEGLPIGNYSSQHLANYYLSYFDHFVKEELHIQYYFRYCDDMVILHSSKDYLHYCEKEISKYLMSRLALELKGNYQVFPVASRGIDFLGYVFFHTHTLIRKRIKYRLIRTIRRNKHNLKESLNSYRGWLSHADAYNLSKKYNLNHSLHE